MTEKHRILSLFLIILICLISNSSAKKSYVEIPDHSDLNGTNYLISPFSPKFFIRSANFTLNSSSCLHFSFKLQERRVRLLAYTCQLSEGGFCTLDKFSFPTDEQGCTYLRPWTRKVDEWSFYFLLEKRPRRFGKAYLERQRQRKIKRQIVSTKKEMSTKPFGHLELYGVVPCAEVCGKKEEKKLGSYSDGTFHRGRPQRLQY